MSYDEMRKLIPRITVHRDEIVQLDVEIVNTWVFMHVEVFEWTPSSLKHMRRIFEQFKVYIADNGYTRLITYTPNPKFVKMFGGVSVNSFDHEGKHYEVMEWALK